MKRVLFFGLVFSILGSLFLQRPLLAVTSKAYPSEVASQSQDIITSDQFFYSATRSVQPIKRVTDDVTVITREEIDRWPVNDLDEALGFVNGVVVQDTGYIGQVATAQIHGSKPREVRVMIDGIPMNATNTGGIADLSQIPLDLVEKIEIIKGASSSVWGSAMGGVINIITRSVGKSLVPHGSGTLSFGSYGTQRERGEVGGAAGPFHYYAFGSHVEDGGFRPNSDELENRAFLKAALPLTDALSLKGSFGYSGSNVSEFDLPSVGVSQKRKVQSRYGNAGLSHTWNDDKVQSDLFYKISERRFRRTTVLLPSQDFFQFSKAQSLIHEMSFQTLIHLATNQSLVLGCDIAVELYRDAVFRATTTRFDVNKESVTQGYYANYQLSWRFIDATIGSRIDSTNSYGANFDPAAGLVMHLPFWNALIRGNVSRAFNAPSLVDRYLSVSTSVSNPDLKAERAIAYNLGPEIEPFSWLRGKSSFFQTFIDDSIMTIRRSDGLFQPVNLTKEKRTGFDNEVMLGPWFGFSPSYGNSFVYAVDGKGNVVQSRPRWTQDLKLNYAHLLPRGFNFNANLIGRYMDLVQYAGFNPPSDQVFIFEGKIVLGFPKILYGNTSIFLIGRNLFNQDFAFDSVNNPNPKRNFEAGFQYHF